MEQDTSKLIEAQFKTLPPPLQRAISLTPWRVLVREVASAERLDAAKAESLETETLLVIYSFESKEDLPDNIARELAVDAMRAGAIAAEIDSKVFSVIESKTNELVKEAGDTLQTTPDVPPETEEIAPRVIVESGMSAEKSNINLIKPALVVPELTLAPPKLGDSLTSLAPMTAPAEKPKNLIDERLQHVVASPIKTSSYPGGIDPYREPTI